MPGELPSPATTNSREARNWLLLFLLATLPYANTLFNAFVYDDIKQILANPYIQSWRYLPEIFSSNVWSFLGEAGVTNHYRPMMTLTYLVCWHIFGPIPFGFHLVNLLFHAGVTWMLYRVTLVLWPDRRLAFLAAALFALHPIHTESVAWVAGITDLQLAFFYLLAFRLYLQLGEPSRPPFLPQLKLGAAFVLALLSKEIALTLPVLATIYEHGLRSDRCDTTLIQKVRRYALLWVIAGLYVAFRLVFLGAIAPLPRRELPKWGEAVLSGVALAAQYLWKLVWPAELSAFYVFRKNLIFAEPAVLLGAVAIALLSLLLVYAWRRNRPVAFAILFGAITLAPVLNARWMAANVFAERYLYLPSAGFCWLLGWMWLRAHDRVGPPALKKTLVVALCTVSVLYAGRTITRNRDWRHDEALYTRTLAQEPDAYLIRNNLGTVYWNRGDAARAEREWKIALAQQPEDVVLLNNLGLAASRKGRFEEAERMFRTAIRIRPAYPEPYVNLGRLYEQLGRNPDAEREYRKAIAQATKHAPARVCLGNLMLREGRAAEALVEFEAASQVLPTAEVFTGLGNAQATMGNPDSAEASFRRAVDLDPYALNARLALARLYRASGRAAQALLEYEAVLNLAPDHAEAKRARLELQQSR